MFRFRFAGMLWRIALHWDGSNGLYGRLINATTGEVWQWLTPLKNRRDFANRVQKILRLF